MKKDFEEEERCFKYSLKVMFDEMEWIDSIRRNT